MQMQRRIILFSLLAVTTTISIAYAWKLNLEFLSGKKLKFIETLDVYFKAGLSRYLPGNVLQYVARNLHAERLGISQTKMATGSFIEVFIVAVSSFILAFSFGGVRFIGLVAEYAPIQFYIIALLVFFIAMCVGVYVLKKSKLYAKLRAHITEQFSDVKLSKFFIFFTKMFGIVAYSHIVLGTVFYFMLKTASGIADANFFIVVSAYIVAWFVGFVTPVAPAGIGVKEAVLSVLLMDVYGGYVLVCALLLRLIIIFAELFMFSTISIVRRIKISR
jgi:hypothetical protein